MTEPRSVNELNADLFQPEEVDRFSDPLEARRKAMDYLARREYGHAELVRKLETAGFARDLAGDAVDRLREEGLQSDDRFAESFVQSRINQGKGPVRIRLELNERALDGAAIDRALEAADADWYRLACKVRVQKFGPALPADFREKARQMRFLQYRGFDGEAIQVAVTSHGDH